MSELGQLLKKARIENGITLDDLQETTKIQKRYLEAIEEGNYKILPGSFYVRAFIKNYAEAVGLDPNEVLKLYRNVIPSPEEETNMETILTKRADSKNTEKINKWISGVVMWSFVILIAGIIYYYISSTHQGNTGEILDDRRITDRTESVAGENVPNPPTAEETGQSDQPSPVAEPPEEKPEVKLSKSEGGVDFYVVTHSAKLTLEMKVTGDRCWIQVDELLDDGTKNTREAKNLVNGDVRKWDLENSVFVTVGKANAIEVKVNGVSIPTGDLPNPKRFEFGLEKT